VRGPALFAIASISLLSGCQSLERDVVAIEHRPGTDPTTVLSSCDAAYELTSPEPNSHIAYATIELAKGATVGFRRETDGSLVAIAGAQTTPISDCHSVWRYTPNPNPRWKRFVSNTHDRYRSAADAMALFFISPFIIVNGCVTGEWP